MPAHVRVGSGSRGGRSLCNRMLGNDLRAKANRIRRLRLRGGALRGNCDCRCAVWTAIATSCACLRSASAERRAATSLAAGRRKWSELVAALSACMLPSHWRRVYPRERASSLDLCDGSQVGGSVGEASSTSRQRSASGPSSSLSADRKMMATIPLATYWLSITRWVSGLH